MFNVRKIKENEIETISKIFEINTNDLINTIDNSMVLIEEDKYKAFGNFIVIDEIHAFIDKLLLNQIFVDLNYKDVLFRSLLNLGLMNGKMFFYVLEDENDFFKQYDFEKISDSKLEEINKKLNKNCKVGYKINVDEFFHRPCNV